MDNRHTKAWQDVRNDETMSQEQKDLFRQHQLQILCGHASLYAVKREKVEKLEQRSEDPQEEYYKTVQEMNIKLNKKKESINNEIFKLKEEIEVHKEGAGFTDPFEEVIRKVAEGQSPNLVHALFSRT